MHGVKMKKESYFSFLFLHLLSIQTISELSDGYNDKQCFSNPKNTHTNTQARTLSIYSYPPLTQTDKPNSPPLARCTSPPPPPLSLCLSHSHYLSPSSQACCNTHLTSPMVSAPSKLLWCNCHVAGKSSVSTHFMGNRESRKVVLLLERGAQIRSAVPPERLDVWGGFTPLSCFKGKLQVCAKQKHLGLGGVGGAANHFACLFPARGHLPIRKVSRGH